MITIAWYNVVAIIAGILFLLWIWATDTDNDLIGISGVVVFIKILLAIIFFVVWGGIFWW